MTRTEIEEIKARADAAQPGPWAWESVGEKSNEFIVGLACDEMGTPLEGCINNTGEEILDTVIRQEMIGANAGGMAHFADAEFLARARTDVPALCDHALRLEDENARLRAFAEGFHHRYNGDNCYYCGWFSVYHEDDTKHAPDCAYIRALAVLAGEAQEND